MTLAEKVQAVESVFDTLDGEIASFQQWSGLHCKAGCGRCCFKPDIEATALEFLPFAHHLYKTGKAFDWLERLKDRSAGVCLILDERSSGVGLCSEYRHRGLICRLFGYSSRTNKYGKKELVTCQVIKTEQAPGYEGAIGGIDKGEPVPVMSHYYMQMLSIDRQLAQDFYPVNEAIRHAIETVLHYYAYRD